MKRKNVLTYLLCAALLIQLVPFSASSRGPLKKIKIHGYVTNILSPTSFEIEDYKITKDREFQLDFENEGADIKFNPEDIRVGTEIEVQGMLNTETDELTAKKVVIDLDQFRKLKNTTILADAPRGIERVGSGWGGILRADGRRIRIDAGTTQVLFEMTKTEKKDQEEKTKEQEKERKRQEKEKKKAGSDASPATPAPSAPESAEDVDEFSDTEPLRDISQVKAGMYMTYEGREDVDGTVNATRVVFMRNEAEKGELKFWDSLSLKEKASNYESSKPGELKINRIGKFKLLPNQQVQEYVSALGNRLVPRFQKELPADDPRKIDFRFFVVIDKEPNAFALANGVVVVHTAMLTLLESEGQLAAVLSHEISHATQEHTWRQLNKDKGKRTAVQVGAIAASVFGFGGVADILNLTLAAMVNGYQRRLENQADRIGLEYLVAAGYDPREAPKVWKIMAKRYGDAPTNFFYSSHDNHSMRRSFLMVEIRNNYSSLDFDALNRGKEKDYEGIVSLTNDALTKKKKIKVKT